MRFVTSITLRKQSTRTCQERHPIDAFRGQALLLRTGVPWNTIPSTTYAFNGSRSIGKWYLKYLTVLRMYIIVRDSSTACNPYDR